MCGVPWTESAGRVRLRASDPPRDEGLEASWRELGDRGMARFPCAYRSLITIERSVSFCGGMQPDCERLTTRNVPRRRVPAEHPVAGYGRSAQRWSSSILVRLTISTLARSGLCAGQVVTSVGTESSTRGRERRPARPARGSTGLRLYKSRPSTPIASLLGPRELWRGESCSERAHEGESARRHASVPRRRRR